MNSTDFLLFLVIFIFAVHIIMNYHKDIAQSESEIQYKIIPVHNSLNADNSLNVDNSDNQPNKSQCVHTSANPCKIENDINIDIHNKNYRDPIDPLRKFDYDAIEDNFTPPFRRSYYDEHDYRVLSSFPTYTRGPPGRFRKVGMLIAQGTTTTNDKYKFLIMMGRQKSHHRDFEYFATSSNTDQRLKFYIDTKGKDIRDGETVIVKELSGYTYIFSEDPDLSPRYDPYII